MEATNDRPPYVAQWLPRKQKILNIATRIKDENPTAWKDTNTPTAPLAARAVFITLVARACVDVTDPVTNKAGLIGNNWKRGHAGEPSLDVLAMVNPTGCEDKTGGQPGLELIDIITGHGDLAKAVIGWGDVTQATIDSGNGGGWVNAADDPTDKDDDFTGEGDDTPVHPDPPRPDAPQPYPDEPEWWGKIFTPALVDLYKQFDRVFPDPHSADATLDGFRVYSRTGYDIRAGLTKEASMAKHLEEWRLELAAQQANAARRGPVSGPATPTE